MKRLFKEDKMAIDRQADEGEKIKALLSTLWIFAVLNYLYCDVLSLFDPSTLNQLIKGSAGGIKVTQEFLLGASVLMEISMSMVLLSRLLNNRTNRITNIAAGTVTTLVQISSLFFGTKPTPYYVFFSVIEISTTAFIVWYASKWAIPKSSTNEHSVSLEEVKCRY
jgi:hypothetical protein